METENLLRTTGTYDLLTDILSILFAIIVLTLLTIAVILIFRKDAKDQDKENEYLKSLSDEERLIIAKYKDNRKTKWFNKKPKDK